MTTNVLIAFYSTYGHIHRMALAVAEGAESVPDTTLRLRRIAELEEARKALSAQDAYVRAQQAQADIPVVTHDDLRWADGIAWGTPTRYGNMSALMKQFVDTTGGLWLKGELEDKATGIFTSTATIHGGQETTILTTLVPLIHLGMVFVGTPYGQNPQILVTDGIGASRAHRIAFANAEISAQAASVIGRRSVGTAFERAITSHFGFPCTIAQTSSNFAMPIVLRDLESMLLRDPPQSPFSTASVRIGPLTMSAARPL